MMGATSARMAANVPTRSASCRTVTLCSPAMVVTKRRWLPLWRRSCSRSAVKEYCQLSRAGRAAASHGQQFGGVTAFRRFFDDKDQLGCRAQRLPCPAVSRPS